MNFELNQQNLFDYLQKNKFEPVLQKDTKQLYILFKSENLQVYIFFIVTSQNQLLQIVAYLPYKLNEKAIPDVARLLHMLNKELDMPGFGMDEKEKLLFYRTTLPCLDGHIDEIILRTHIGTVQVACDSFMHAIGAVASGSVSLQEFLKENP